MPPYLGCLVPRYYPNIPQLQSVSVQAARMRTCTVLFINFLLISPLFGYYVIYLPPYLSMRQILSHHQSRMGRFVFDAPTMFGASCAGSVEIETKDGQKIIVSETVPKTRISFDKIRVVGCGCFSIHSARNGIGARQVLFSSEPVRNSDLGFGKIRSILRIPCPLY